MIPDFAFVRPFREGDLPVLVEAAKEDKHIVLPPGLVVEKQGEVCGYFHTSPSTFAWLSTKKLTPRDTFHLVNTVENLIASPVLQWPIPKESPLHGQMEAMGYKKMGTFDVFIRGPF